MSALVSHRVTRLSNGTMAMLEEELLHFLRKHRNDLAALIIQVKTLTETVKAQVEAGADAHSISVLIDLLLRAQEQVAQKAEERARFKRNASLMLIATGKYKGGRVPNIINQIKKIRAATGSRDEASHSSRVPKGFYKRITREAYISVNVSYKNSFLDEEEDEP